MARVLAVFDDLLLGSNILGMLRAAGLEATLTGAAGAEPSGCDVMVVDLAADGFDGVELVERLRTSGELGDTRLLGVYSHVHHEQRVRAEAAGFDLVVPRSRMAREGAALVQGLAGGGPTPG
jgi:CheY-like chemotaxis protein